MIGKHRGGRRSWRRRAPGIVVALLAAASAGGVAEAALQGSQPQAGVTGAGGGILTLAAGLVGWSRRHAAEHRLAHAPVSAAPDTGTLLPTTTPAPGVLPGQPAIAAPRSAVAVAMSTPPAPRPWSTAGPTGAPALFVVPTPSPATANASRAATAQAHWAPDPMVDTVPHPVVKLFPMAPPQPDVAAPSQPFEPDQAAATIDERVYAALDAQREEAVTAQLARGRHADLATSAFPVTGPRRTMAYRPYQSRHSA